MPPRKSAPRAASDVLTESYPHVARWVLDGWIEIGRTDAGTPSFVRALDEGGLVWEGAATYASLDAALAALDAGIAAWMTGEGIA